MQQVVSPIPKEVRVDNSFRYISFSQPARDRKLSDKATMTHLTL